MKSADPRKRDDVATAWGLDGTRDGRVAVERHVRPVLVVVDDVRSDQAQQMSLSEDDDVIEEFSTQSTHPVVSQKSTARDFRPIGRGVSLAGRPGYRPPT
jgi:hypothetical protein